MSDKRPVLPPYGLAEDVLGKPAAARASERASEPVPAALTAPRKDGLLSFADELARRDAAQEHATRVPELGLVSFKLGVEDYAIPIERVREIIRVGDITRVPDAPPHIRGVANVRGRILPVVELRTRLGLPPVELTGKARTLLSGGGGGSNLPAVIEEGATNLPATISAADPAQPGPSLDAPVAIPDNPGVLVKNNRQMLLELKVDPQTFTDRTGFVNMCQVCYAPALRGSAFCPNCGRPLTLEAVQPELRGNAQKSARSGLTYGLIGLALNVVPLLILVLPALLAEPATAPLLERIRETLSPLTIALAAILGILPAMVCGFLALRQGQRAAWFLNLPAVLEQNGRGQAGLGTALGWLSIYAGVAWILLIVIALL